MNVLEATPYLHSYPYRSGEKCMHFFPDNLGDVTGMYGELFHWDIMQMEKHLYVL